MPMHWYAAMLLVLLMGVAAAQAPAGEPDQARRLIEQKIRLLEMLIDSPAARSVPRGRETEAAQLVEQGRHAIDTAKQALSGNRLEDATALLDEALRAISAASRRLSAGGGALSESAQRKTLADLSDQVAMYRASLEALRRDDAGGAAAQALLRRIDDASAQARRLADDGQLGDANRKMAEAYRLAIEEISRLRAGQEVVMSLAFDSPADEYAYELRRYSSNEIMIEMMIGEGRAEGDRRRLVDTFVGEGRKLKDEAEARAGAARYDDAVALMEKATGQLNRALQSMGVPVF